MEAAPRLWMDRPSDWATSCSPLFGCRFEGSLEIVRWAPRPVAGRPMELVTLVCLLRMMKATEPGQSIQLGDPRSRPRLDVVDLQVTRNVASRNDAFSIAYFEGAALMGRDSASKVGDTVDIDTVRHDGPQVGVGHHRLDRCHRQWSDPGDLAGLPLNRVSAKEGGVVDQDVDRRARPAAVTASAGPSLRRPAGEVAPCGGSHGHEGIREVGVIRLARGLRLGRRRRRRLRMVRAPRRPRPWRRG